MRFHFDCYALVEIEDEDTPRLLDFYASERFALGSIEAMRLKDREAQAEYREYWSQINLGVIRPRKFEIIPLANIEGRSMDAIEQAILDAAMLRVRGIGKEIAR